MTHDVNTLRDWLLWLVYIAAFGATSTPVLYSFSPWRKTNLGRRFMLQSLAFAATIDLTVLFQFWHPTDILVYFWVEVFVFLLIAVASLALTYMIWSLNHKRGPNYEGQVDE